VVVGSGLARSAIRAESLLVYLVEFKNGRLIRMWSYLDPKEALEAAGLRG
jgi:hypothetical protein